MQYVARLILSPLLAASLILGASAMEGPFKGEPGRGGAEYRLSDTHFYPRGDVLRTHPGATILAVGSYQQKGDSYFVSSPGKAPKTVYVQVLHDWIEPITPPNMPASLGIAPDAMQIREVQGDVKVALPTAPASFLPATVGMNLVNGAVIKTGADGTVAVLFGGVESARLIPGSEAAVQQTVTAESRITEVDLSAGAVFSKVGTQVDVKEAYSVKTPSGVAAAHGTDFVTVALPARTDVWVAQGTVTLMRPEGQVALTATSDGTGPLKVIRLPALTDVHQSVAADTETLSAAMNFISMANQKIKALRDKMAAGAQLTDSEQAYLARLKQVPCLVKLTLVEPTPLAVQPRMTAPALAPLPSVAAVSTSSADSIDLVLLADGTVVFQGVTLTLDELKPQLESIGQATPNQPILIKGRENVSRDQLKKVRALCREAKIVNVSLAKAEPRAIPAIRAEAEPANLPSAGLTLHPGAGPTPESKPAGP